MVTLTHSGQLRKMKAEAEHVIQLQTCKIRLLEESKGYWKGQAESSLKMIGEHIEKCPWHSLDVAPLVPPT